MYISSLFRYNLKYAESFDPDKIFILSAKHGLLDLEDEIEPYERTLNSMHSTEIKEGADLVINQLGQIVDLNSDEIILLAGENYRKYLIPHIAHYSIPLKGLTFGKQLGYLKKVTSGD